MKRPLVLTVAGSDSSGGAGLQADLATFQAMDCVGCTVVTAVTAQGPRGVTAWEAVSLDLVREQLAVILDEIGPASLKTGMLATPEIIAVVADGVRTRPRLPMVVDPVAVSTSGHDLLGPGGLDALRDRLIPLATVVTPNAMEAAALTSRNVSTLEEAEAAGRALLDAGAGAALITGGHLRPLGTDVLVTSAGTRFFEGEEIRTEEVHGTGCVLSAGIACGLARGAALGDAVREAKALVTERIRAAASGARADAGPRAR